MSDPDQTGTDATDSHAHGQPGPAPASVVHARRPDVSILIVAFNSADLIGACINAIPAACDTRSYEILLVDNGDSSTETLVKERFPLVRIVPSQGNVGFAAGNNLLAREAKGAYLLLLNPDMVPFAGAIASLLQATERYPDAGAWGGVTVDAAGLPDTGNDTPIPSIRRLAAGVIGYNPLAREPATGLKHDTTVEALCGGFVMFPKELWERAGGLDPRYFLYYEEIDLFFRLERMGYTFWRIADARGYHALGHGNGLSATRLLYRAAGALQFARIHWNFASQVLAFLLIWMAALARYVAGSLFAWRSERLARLGEGYRLVALKPHHWGFGYHPKFGLLTRIRRSAENSSH